MMDFEFFKRLELSRLAELIVPELGPVFSVPVDFIATDSDV